jgi:hypothetical protein
MPAVQGGQPDYNFNTANFPVTLHIDFCFGRGAGCGLQYQAGRNLTVPWGCSAIDSKAMNKATNQVWLKRCCSY